PEHGRLYDHTQMQGVVHVSPDGQTAKGRWRALVFGGNEGGISVFGDCIYENEYRKEDGVWKLSKLHSYFIMYTNWDQGWAKLGWPNTRPEEELPPDRPPTVVYDMYPGELTAPMHYENPVTGGPVFAEAAGAAAAQPPAGATDPSVGAEPSGDRRASAPPAPIDIRAGLESLRRRIGLLEDAKAVERLHNVYGYYLDDRRWDELADLFADDGTLEMGQRGVYAGKARVRASLDLLGPAGPRDGLIESHYQYQPVVHVAPDGQSAELRAREFVLSGEHGGAAYVGGSVYENEYVKEDGVWKIASSHPYTTFLADYTRGWSHGALPMPGPSDALPPDRPPSVEYEAFPAFNLLPPFHYDHPVTGRPIAR
ncbi:MAG: nuclear transport factor 2 family protein, partial [Gammaproteobacteria bacterium]|nr:nuclear transport factor 2 family protein [Gammaproteobacteria bacterium]